MKTESMWGEFCVLFLWVLMFGGSFFCFLCIICAAGTVRAPHLVRDSAFHKFARTVDFNFFFSIFPNRLHHNLVPLEKNIYYKEQCFFAVTLEATWYLQNAFLLRCGNALSTPMGDLWCLFILIYEIPCIRQGRKINMQSASRLLMELPCISPQKLTLKLLFMHKSKYVN